MSDFRIRSVEHPDDPAWPFVFDTWVGSYLAAARKNAPNELAQALSARPEAGPLVRKWVGELAKGSEVALMVDGEQPDVYAGWACGSVYALHFVYVKKVFRRLGLGGQLIDQLGSPSRYSLSTWPKHDRWLESRGMIYDPKVRLFP